MSCPWDDPTRIGFVELEKLVSELRESEVVIDFLGPFYFFPSFYRRLKMSEMMQDFCHIKISVPCVCAQLQVRLPNGLQKVGRRSHR